MHACLQEASVDGQGEGNGEGTERAGERDHGRSWRSNILRLPPQLPCKVLWAETHPTHVTLNLPWNVHWDRAQSRCLITLTETRNCHLNTKKFVANILSFLTWALFTPGNMKWVVDQLNYPTCHKLTKLRPELRNIPKMYALYFFAILSLKLLYHSKYFIFYCTYLGFVLVH